jgi:hypothetical protein
MEMFGIKKLCVLGLALALSACVSSEPASRSMSGDALTLASRGSGSIPETGSVRVMAAQYDVADVQVTVPRELRVSEANTFYPMADIVWRGDALGDRHVQIASIFNDAAQRATGGMNTGRTVAVQIELVRFHGVTEKTRYTVGGTHNMVFDLTVRDAASGAVLDGPRRVVADAKAAGGQAAIAEEQAGRTQRVVVTEKLVEVLRRELSAPVTDPALVARATQAPGTPVLVTR